MDLAVWLFSFNWLIIFIYDDDGNSFNQNRKLLKRNYVYAWNKKQIRKFIASF